MRCKKHYTDLSSAIGVCACCLRERLLFLIAAQEQSSSLADNTTSFHHHSLSPFINHRKSDPNHHPPHAPRYHRTFSDQLFYQTPQLNPTTTAAVDISGAIHSNKKRSFIRFFSFQNIFRFKNRNPVDPPDACAGDNATSSASWFSIIYNRRHRRKKTASDDEATTAAAAACGGVRQQCGNRGMSPVRTSEYNEDGLCNGYESTESWKNTPRRTPAVKRGGGHARNLSFCLSPLVRASPNRQRNTKGLQSDGGLSGEIRAPVKPHLSNTKLFCANRSRKLADFGRANLNR